MSEAPLFLLAGVVMIGVLVIVHEAGHYVVARLFGVGTPVFSIGMGPRIFGFRFWETDFRISLLPIGGYVRMSGADAFGEEDAEDWVKPEENFMARPVWQRFLIMLAGPAANIALPFILFTAIYMLGRPQPDAAVGRVGPGSVAQELGVEVGDRIVSVGDTEVRDWTEFLREADNYDGNAVTLGLTRDQQRYTIDVPAGVMPGHWTKIETELGLSHDSLSSRIGVSDRASPAYAAGLRTGDLIEKVDGEIVASFVDLQAALRPVTEAHALTVQRVTGTDENGALKQEELSIELAPSDGWVAASTEVLPDPWGFIPIEVFTGQVIVGSAAEEAGLQQGDRLYAIDGNRIRSWEDVVDLVSSTVQNTDLEQAALRSGGCMSSEETFGEGRTLRLDVVRDGVIETLTFKPRVQRFVVMNEVVFRPIMGVKPYGGTRSPGVWEPAYYSVDRAIPLAVNDGVGAIKQTLSVLGKLLQGELKAKESLGGPIEIVRTAGIAAKGGFHEFALVMGLISFSLGIVNLLPIPVLDGGQILFYAIEGIRGRPLPLAFRERVQMVGVLFLAALMVMVLVNDIGRWFEG